MSANKPRELQTLASELERLRNWYERHMPDKQTIYIERHHYAWLMEGHKLAGFRCDGKKLMYGNFQLLPVPGKPN